MEGRERTVGTVSVSVHGEGDTAIVLGPGAGGTRRTPALVTLAEDLAARGRTVILFNFPYSEAGRRVPDPPARLEATVAEVAAFARGTLGARRVVPGGRSMGGRMASQAVARGLAADALLLLAYPLHPPGQPDRLRDAHLPAVGVPMLFVQGTRDAFSTPALLDAVVARLAPRASLHRVEGADHSFHVRRGDPRGADGVRREIVDAVSAWLSVRGL